VRVPRILPRDREAAVVLVLSAPLLAWVGIRIGQPILMPVLTALPAILVFADRIQAGRLGAALGLMVLWAVASSTSVILNTQWDPVGAEAAIWQGAAYRDEMFTWIRSGIGREGSPRLFLPQHALHYGGFLVLSALTAGGAGLVMGAVLLNYMSFYVGSLFVNDVGSDSTWTLALMGWPIWSMVRVVGYIAGGVAMAWLFRTAIRRLKDEPGRWPGPASHFLSLSLALVILDVLLKALLASHWQLTLQKALAP